ncbi:MAG: ABC transporter permease subunit, partial [Streptococcus salivarius]|nr:ABC transporter permease subunit [Streptococcus salivarius]
MIIDFSLILKSIPYVLSGLPYTLGISLLSFMVGNVFAIILAFMRMSQKPWLKYPARIYISIMRGVPMLVVLFILSFGLTYVGVQLPALLCAFIGFS